MAGRKSGRAGETAATLHAGAFFCLGEVLSLLLWRRLQEDPPKGLPEELRLLRRMFRERLREGLPEASRKRLREVAGEGLRVAPRERLREARRKGLREAPR
jgi:hypothetical protein